MPDGELILNARDWSGRFVRAIHTSRDGGMTWKLQKHDPTLIEPEPQGCQGSTLATPRAAIAHGALRAAPPGSLAPGHAQSEGILFFCNPLSTSCIFLP